MAPHRRISVVLGPLIVAASVIVGLPTSAVALASGTYIVTTNGAAPAASTSGRYVAFLTADQLAPSDTNAINDAYVRDVQTGDVALASDPVRGASEVDISDDGNRVAFRTTLNGQSEAFVRDLTTGQLMSASRGSSGAVPDSGVQGVVISGDGMAVAFFTQASNFGIPTGPGHDVFVKRLDTGVLELASSDASGGPGNASSFWPSLSADGRQVAFISTATNLAPGDTDPGQDVYRKNLDIGAVAVDSLAGFQATGAPSLNAVGSQVAYGLLLSPSNSPAGIRHYNFDTGTSATIDPSPCSSAGRPRLDGSGDRVGMVCLGSPSVVLKDHMTGALLSVQTANALAVDVSADGLAFAWDDYGQFAATTRVQRLTSTDESAPVISYELLPGAPDGDADWYRGDVTLIWHVTDPESAVVTQGCADQVVSVDQLETSYSCSAVSDGGSSGPVVVTVKRDGTAPILTAVTAPAVPDGDNGWYVTAPVMSFTCIDVTSGVAECPGNWSVDEGVGMVSAQSRDHAGNSGAALFGPFSVDLTDPSMACGPTTTFELNQPAPVVSATVSDSGSGPAEAMVSSVVDTSTPGSRTVFLVGRDSAGRSTTVTCGYQVGFRFDGFQAPVDNGAVNVLKAGQAVPLKWQVTDALGLGVTNLTQVSLTVAGRACDLGATQDLLEESASGASGLQNLGGGRYQFNWKTPKSYALSCKVLRLDVGDGVVHTAEFRFTR